jgi:hypothetical protein
MQLHISNAAQQANTVVDALDAAAAENPAPGAGEPGRTV